MYLEYWGLQKYPFENTPDPEFFFFSSEHEEALSRITYGIRRNKGALLLTGEIGCGKTLLSRVLIKQMQHENIDIGLIANPSLEPLDFLSETLYQLGLSSQATTKTEMLKTLNNKLMENSNKSTISLLIIDEAQTIYKDTFEEIRMLLNFQMNDRYLLNLLFLGQPELRDMIVSNKQLDQRVAIRYHLNPLSRSDTTKYILFRLEKAGLKKNIFSDEAFETICAYSGGVPRKINNICDLALLIGFGLKVELIDQNIVSGIIKDSL
ncbi:MAG: AAA family ATPase [Syntrophales bacterium]|nr:AAA family ATPase [Syntrophales bacterium]